MALTVTALNHAKPREKAYKLSDDRGLYAVVTPGGNVLWRFKYRINGVGPDRKPKRIEKLLSLGQYPDVGLAAARQLRDEARALIARGIDPGFNKQREKEAARISAANTFEGVAEEYIETKMRMEGKAPATIRKAEWFLKLLTPALGKRPIAEIEPYELLDVLKKMERKGRLETATKCLQFAGRVFRYGVATVRCKADPAHLLRDALTKPRATPMPAFTDPDDVAALMRAIDTYKGHQVTCIALAIAPHVFVRPGELRHARWEEIDLEKRIWTIPAVRMKQRRNHAVPLSRQVMEQLDELQSFVGTRGYLFPSARDPKRPMSENTLNGALRRLGYSKHDVTAHGFRATASTLLNESGLWHPDAIERALSHGHSDVVRGRYHRGEYWNERVEMAQWWSDYLDRLKSGVE